MAASAHLKTVPSSQSQSQLQSQAQINPPPRSKRRKNGSSVASAFPDVVSSHSAWCFPVSKHHHQTQSASSSPSRHPRRNTDLSSPRDNPAVSPAQETIRVSSPLMDGAGLPVYPSCYNKFNSALNAGLLNPMSPPPADKIRSSPTLFDMMTNEHEYHPRTSALAPSGQILPHGRSAVATAPDRQVLLQERVAAILGSCSPGNQFNEGDTGDIRLTLSSKDGLSVSLSVHRHILIAHSRFFAAKLSDRWSKQQRSLPHLVEISDCDDVEVYIETLRLMYCKDLRCCLLREDVSKVLGILKVSAAIAFDAGVLSCLEYLEAAPWAEDEEEKVTSVLSQLHLDSSGAEDVLKRVSLQVPYEANGNSTKGNSEEILLRLLGVILEGRDEKARREMKGLVSKMLRENNGGRGGTRDLSKESFYSACDGCLRLLRSHFLLAASSNITDASQIARQADNLHWILDILIDRQIADEFLRIWATETELAEAHPQVPAIHRYEVSRITSRLFVGIGKGQILAPKEARCLLLRTWLEPFYEDFGWMRRACNGLDRHLIEDGLGNTILTLPLAIQQEIFLAWFDRFLNSGEDCPNIQRGFEVWWRRAFWRRNGEISRPSQLRIATVCHNKSS